MILTLSLDQQGDLSGPARDPPLDQLLARSWTEN
jgi:hypothetical protein